MPQLGTWKDLGKRKFERVWLNGCPTLTLSLSFPERLIFEPGHLHCLSGHCLSRLSAPIQFPQPRTRRYIFNAAWTGLAKMCHSLDCVLSAMTATTHPRWQRNTHLPRFYPITRRFHNLCIRPFLSVTLRGGTITNSRFTKGSTCRVRDRLELQLAMLVRFPSRVEKGAPSPNNDTDTNHTAVIAPSWGGTC